MGVVQQNIIFKLLFLSSLLLVLLSKINLSLWLIWHFKNIIEFLYLSLYYNIMHTTLSRTKLSSSLLFQHIHNLLYCVSFCLRSTSRSIPLPWIKFLEANYCVKSMRVVVGLSFIYKMILLLLLLSRSKCELLSVI